MTSHKPQEAFSELASAIKEAIEDMLNQEEKENKQVVANDQVTISKTVFVKLEKAKELLNKAKEHEKRAEVLESERKKDEEDLKAIRRKYNIT